MTLLDVLFISASFAAMFLTYSLVWCLTAEKEAKK